MQENNTMAKKDSQKLLVVRISLNEKDPEHKLLLDFVSTGENSIAGTLRNIMIIGQWAYKKDVNQQLSVMPKSKKKKQNQTTKIQIRFRRDTPMLTSLVNEFDAVNHVYGATAQLADEYLRKGLDTLKKAAQDKGVLQELERFGAGNIAELVAQIRLHSSDFKHEESSLRHAPSKLEVVAPVAESVDTDADIETKRNDNKQMFKGLLSVADTANKE